MCIRPIPADHPVFLCVRCGDGVVAPDVEMGDIVIVQTDFPDHSYSLLSRFLHRLERGTKLLSYLNLVPRSRRPPRAFCAALLHALFPLPSPLPSRLPRRPTRGTR